MAGDGGGNPRAQAVKCLIRCGFVGVGSGLFDHFAERPLQLSALQAHGGGFHRKCLWAKGFHLKTVGFELLGNAREHYHLLGLELHKHGHQQALALHVFHLAVAQDFFKKHPFVCNVLIDDPQAVVAGGQNERFAQLAERLERAQMVEAAGRLLGFNQGCCRCWIFVVTCCAPII